LFLPEKTCTTELTEKKTITTEPTEKNKEIIELFSNMNLSLLALFPLWVLT
jgi:hypothetical protein